MTKTQRVHTWIGVSIVALLLIITAGAVLAIYGSRTDLPATEHLALADAFQAATSLDYFVDDSTEPERRHIAFAEARAALAEARTKVHSKRGRDLLHVITLYEGELEKVPSLDQACATSRFPFFDALKQPKTFSPDQAEAVSKPFFACMLRRQNLDDNINVCRAQAWAVLGGKSAAQPPYGLCDYRVNRLTPERR